MVRPFIKEMRIHQWAKNLLIFAPFLASHSYQNPQTIGPVLIAFFCFSMCASGVYFLNDLLDLEADRNHPTKKNRPLASGALPKSAGIAGAIVLPGLAIALAALKLPTAFLAVLISYYVLTMLYSLYLKRIVVVDVFLLAILYVVRVWAGAAAIDVEISSWFLGFAGFIFLSLAYMKRYIEIADLPQGEAILNRGYSSADKDATFSLGISSLIASVVVLTLFINSESVTGVYASPFLLWLLSLLVLFWGHRIWVLAHRGEVHEDPVAFAIKDRVSQIVGILFLFVLVFAKTLEL